MRARVRVGESASRGAPSLSDASKPTFHLITNGSDGWLYDSVGGCVTRNLYKKAVLEYLLATVQRFNRSTKHTGMLASPRR